MINMPEELNKFLSNNYTYKKGNHFRFNSEFLLINKRREQKEPELHNVTLELCKNKLKDWNTFYNITLKNGSKEFSCNLMNGSSLSKSLCKIVSGVNVDLDENTFIISFQLVKIADL